MEYSLQKIISKCSALYADIIEVIYFIFSASCHFQVRTYKILDSYRMEARPTSKHIKALEVDICFVKAQLKYLLFDGRTQISRGAYCFGQNSVIFKAEGGYQTMLR